MTVAHLGHAELRVTDMERSRWFFTEVLGLYVTEDTYVGGNGYSLRLRGLEEGVNDMAWDRLIVMHGASYVSREAVKALGRLGRSWGCPAVRREVAKKIIDTVRGGSAVFAYYPEKAWLASSVFLRSR